MRVPWLGVLEAYLVQALLRSPAFHTMVRGVHRNVHEFKSGYMPYLVEELKLQARMKGNPRLKDQYQSMFREQQQHKPPSAAPGQQQQQQQQSKDSPKTFFQHFVDEVRNQAAELKGKR